MKEGIFLCSLFGCNKLYIFILEKLRSCWVFRINTLCFKGEKILQKTLFDIFLIYKNAKTSFHLFHIHFQSRKIHSVSCQFTLLSILYNEDEDESYNIHRICRKAYVKAFQLTIVTYWHCCRSRKKVTKFFSLRIEFKIEDLLTNAKLFSLYTTKRKWNELWIFSSSPWQ